MLTDDPGDQRASAEHAPRTGFWEITLSYQLAGLCLAALENLDRARALPNEYQLLWKQVAAVLCAAGTVLGIAMFGLERLRLRLRQPASRFYPFVCAAVLYPIGSSLASGDWVSRQWFASLIAPTVAAIGAVALWCAFRAHARLLRGRAVRVVVFALSAVIPAALDARVLPTTYPALHYALLAAAWVLFALACRELIEYRLPIRLQRAGAAALALSVPVALLKAPNSSHREIWSRSASYAKRVHQPVRYAYWRGVTLTSSDRYAAPIAVWVNQQAKPKALSRELASASWQRARHLGEVPASAQPGAAPDIVLVTVDTLRADTAASSPRWSALAAGGRAFTNAYSLASSTQRSLVTAFSGSSDQTQHDRTVVKALSEQGYHTAFVTDERVHRGFRLLELAWIHHFEEVQRFDPVEGHTSPAITQAALDILRAPRTQPLLLWVHYADLHDWYKVRATRSLAPTERYADAWRQVEDEVDTLVREALSRRGRPQLLMLSSDHGENIDVEGRTTHSQWLDYALVRIPLVVLGTGIAPARVDEPVAILDIAPTIAHAASLPFASEGVSLLQDARSAQRVIVMGDTKEIAIVRGTERLVLTPTAGLLRLFDDANPSLPGRVVDVEGPWRDTMLLPLLGSPMSGTLTSPLLDSLF